jgi:hypothetical protein
MNGETDRVYVYKLCNECFKEVKDDEKWLLILEDDIELALKTQPRYKFGEGLSQQEKDRLARWILLGKE